MMGYLLYNKLFSHTLSARARISFNQQLIGIPLNLTSTFKPALGFSGEMLINWLPFPEHSLSMGIDYKRDQVESEYYKKRSANGFSPFIQEIWKISQIWQLNAGLRYDTYNLVGDSVETQLSPRVGLSYQPRSGTIIHFSYGRGFRAASVVERFLSVDTGGDVKVLPNPRLRPERSTLFDFGLRQSLGRSVYTEITAFLSRYQNLIELTLVPQSLNVQYITQPDAEIYGIETVFHWTVWQDRINIKTNFTWMEPKFSASEQPLPYRPRFIGFFTPEFRYGPFEFGADFRYSSKLQKVLIYPKDEQVPAKIWNLRFGYEKNGKLE